MRLNEDPNLPNEGAQAFTATLLLRLNELFRTLHTQVNCITEGRVECITNAYTAAPTAGRHAQGDEVKNSTPTELGTPGSKYVIVGWKCVAGGEPGTWVEMRTLTGN